MFLGKRFLSGCLDRLFRHFALPFRMFRGNDPAVPGGMRSMPLRQSV